MNEDISDILRESKTIAIVGLSAKPSSDSYGIGTYLLQQGYTIIPINPTIKEWNGLISYADLLQVPQQIDIVDIFRRPEIVPEIVELAIAVKAKVVWMQLGVIHHDAAKRAEDAGLRVVMDRCIGVEHRFYSK